jgi:hypothetical protein
MSERGIDRVIGEWWAATETLAALVPPDRLVAEIDTREEGEDRDDNNDGYFDETVIFDITTEPAWRTNSAQGWRSQVVLSCLSIDYDVSKQIATAITNAWANQGFSGSVNSITTCKPTGAITTMQDEATGVWETAVRFDMWHQGDV